MWFSGPGWRLAGKIPANSDDQGVRKGHRRGEQLTVRGCAEGIAGRERPEATVHGEGESGSGEALLRRWWWRWWPTGGSGSLNGVCVTHLRAQQAAVSNEGQGSMKRCGGEALVLCMSCVRRRAQGVKAFIVR